MAQVVKRRPEFEGYAEAIRQTRSRLQSSSQRRFNAASGGLWIVPRRSLGRMNSVDTVKKQEDLPRIVCSIVQRKEAEVKAWEEGIPPCVQVLGLGTLFPTQLPTVEEPRVETIVDAILFTDRSGKHPAEKAHTRCGLLAVYHAELHAIVVACEMQKESARYHAGNAEADLLASGAVQQLPGLPPFLEPLVLLRMTLSTKSQHQRSKGQLSALLLPFSRGRRNRRPLPSLNCTGKAKANNMRQGNAHPKLVGGVVKPAPPPESKAPHRGPRPNKRQKATKLPEVPLVMLASLAEGIANDFGETQLDTVGSSGGTGAQTSPSVVVDANDDKRTACGRREGIRRCEFPRSRFACKDHLSERKKAHKGI
eukprot:1703337-Amphidinium_carterae.1